MALTKISTGMLKQDAASSDLNIDAGTLYIDVSNNRVGIANTSPSQALDVTGNVVISGTATATTFVGSGASLTSIPNSALTNSSITINSTATSLGGSITLSTDDVAEGSSNLYYTNARADARVALIVDSAPSTLNTLNELAAALGDDANFSTTVTNSIAAKLPLAGGTLTGNLSLGDNVKAQFGASSDLQIYHDGSASRIVDAGTGGLTLQADANVVVQNSAGTEVKAEFTTDGGVNLYYDNAQKLATTSTGIDVTGTMQSDGIVSDGLSTIRVSGAGVTTDALKVYSTDGTSNNSQVRVYFGANDYSTTGRGLRIDAGRDSGADGIATFYSVDQPEHSDYEAIKILTDGGVTLSHLGLNKFATTSTGIDVTGEVRSNSLKVDGGTNTEGLTAEVSGVVTDLTIGGITTGADLRFSYNRGNGSTTISEGTRGSETNLQRWAGNGDISFYNDAGTSTDFYWDASTSRLGIGTTLPLTTLEIEDATSQLTIDSTGSSFSRVIHQHNGTSLWTTGTRSASDYHIFRESGAGNVIIDQANVGIGTTSPTQKLEVAGTALVENAKLKAIAESNTDTAVDVFVYDTRKDSDGGAWRKRTQNTSWYNETLNTSTRGSRREFPCVAVIVAETTQLTIYDGDDPSIPMWMVFNRTGSVGSNGNIIQDQYNHQPMPVVALDASIVVGGSFTVKINFASDISYLWADGSGDWIYKAGISKRNAGLGFTNLDNGNRIINAIINDVAMTVLPNAPIDADTGLPIPTIAVATNGGVSIIKDDGSVVDIINTQDSSAFNYIDNLFFRKDGALVWVGDSASNTAAERFVQVLHALPTADTNQGTVENSSVIDEQYGPSHKNGSELRWATTAGVKATSDAGENFAVGTSGALHLVKYNREVEQEGAIAHITSDYNTGYMQGDIKLATLSDTSTTNVTGGTQPDRSYNNNALTVNGTVTKTAVATGAELVAYSGFSSSNYLQQPYNADLQFGTGDFSITCWVKAGTSEAYRRFISIQDPSGQQGNNDAINIKYSPYSTNGFIYAYLGVAEGVIATPNNSVPANVWHQVILTRKNSNYYLYLNGALSDSIASTQSKGSTSHVLRVGGGAEGLEVFSDGSIALVRISKTAPSEEQIKKMYNDEKRLFQENAKCTLYGSSDAVTALAYDDDTELLHVGTSAGRSVFQGLNRVDNTTDAVGAAISASNGFIVEE